MNANQQKPTMSNQDWLNYIQSRALQTPKPSFSAQPATKRGRPLKRKTPLPIQITTGWMYWNLIEEILDTANSETPLSETLLIWADEERQTYMYEWAMEHPQQQLEFTWPLWPTGNDNIQIHSIWARLKRQNPARRLYTVPAATRPDPENEDNSNATIALAQAQRHRWQTIMGTHHA